MTIALIGGARRPLLDVAIGALGLVALGSFAIPTRFNFAAKLPLFAYTLSPWSAFAPFALLRPEEPRRFISKRARDLDTGRARLILAIALSVAITLMRDDSPRGAWLIALLAVGPLLDDLDRGPSRPMLGVAIGCAALLMGLDLRASSHALGALMDPDHVVKVERLARHVSGGLFLVGLASLALLGCPLPRRLTRRRGQLILTITALTSASAIVIWSRSR